MFSSSFRNSSLTKPISKIMRETLQKYSLVCIRTLKVNWQWIFFLARTLFPGQQIQLIQHFRKIIFHVRARLHMTKNFPTNIRRIFVDGEFITLKKNCDTFIFVQYLDLLVSFANFIYKKSWTKKILRRIFAEYSSANSLSYVDGPLAKENWVIMLA